LRARVAARRRNERDASEATLDLLERQPAFWEGFDVAESGSVITADTASPECVEHTCGALRRAD
jgi:predicted kinase